MPNRASSSRVRSRSARVVAFESLYRDNYAFVWRCLRRLGVRAETEDATQEVFVTAYRRLPTFEGRSSVRGWLAGIARKIAFRWRRTQERRDRRHEALKPIVEIATEGIEDWTRSREAIVFLDVFVEGLSPEKRGMFVLCELEGLQGREAAQALGLNPNTAYSRLRAARASFERACAAVQSEADPAAETRARQAHRQSPPPRAAQRGWVAFVAQTGYGLTATVAGSTPLSAIGTWSSAKIVAVIVLVGGLAVGTARVLTPDVHARPSAPPVASQALPAQPEPPAAAPTHPGVAPGSADDPPQAAPPTAAPPPNARKEPTATDSHGPQPTEAIAAASDTTPRPSSDSSRARAEAQHETPPSDIGLTGPEQALLERASAAYGSGQFQEAITLGTDLLARYPHSFLSSDARSLLVRAHCALEQPDRAAVAARELPADEGRLLLRRYCGPASRDRQAAETTHAQ